MNLKTHAPLTTNFTSHARFTLAAHAAPAPAPAHESASADRCGFFCAAGVFATTVLLALLFPLSRFVLFPFDLLAARDSAQHWHHLLTHAEAVRLSVLQWTAATLLFGACAKKESSVIVIPLALAGLTLTTLTLHATVRVLGMDFYWDLWH